MAPFLSFRMCSAGQCESGKERALATKLLREVRVQVRQEHVHTKSAEKWKTGSALHACRTIQLIVEMAIIPEPQWWGWTWNHKKKKDGKHGKHIPTSGNGAFSDHWSLTVLPWFLRAAVRTNVTRLKPTRSPWRDNVTDCFGSVCTASQVRVTTNRKTK